MSVLSSVPSATSFLSPKSNVNGNEPHSELSPAVYPSAYTKALPSAKLANDNISLTPDELFTKHTVVEVRAVQKRLRTDAEAKQEELRLMVGERYRDLLQASSSIISIAKSSKRVLEAVVESKNAILSQDDLPPPPKTAAVVGVDDRRLFSLQTLSAHMKLLLDAPEHLWRLIERKKYLQAGWLFLLSRVVYRALVSHDENDEQTWAEDGIDVQRDFPLVQRQWDVVSQFRPQIIHKSTLSLREASASAKDVCATLVALHLLDSRPLNETLAALFLQRSKTLQTILSWKSGPKSSTKERDSTSLNGKAGPPKSVPVREVAQVMKNALNTIAQTVSTSRLIFYGNNSEPALIFRILESIQTDSELSLSELPKELQLSTQSLLSQLTSSAYFQLLPGDLRSYRPYIDLESSLSSLPRPLFVQKLQDWFKSSCKQWRDSASEWFSCLRSVKEVWTLRTAVKRLIASYGLDDKERDHVCSQIDSLCHDRIINIWMRALSAAEDEFKSRLRTSSAVADGSKQDASPADFLFSPPPIPILSQTIKSFVDTPFQKYQLALKRQLAGRSAQLDNVISTLEQCARTIQSDFSIIRGGGDEKSRPFIQRLSQGYQPAAEALSSKIIDVVDEVTTAVITDPESTTASFVFLSRATDMLFSSSTFIDNIGCDAKTNDAFREKLASMNDKALRQWREITVKRVVSELKSQSIKSSSTNGPSSPLLRSLLSIANDIQELGVVYHPKKQEAIVQDTLRQFLSSFLEDTMDVSDEQTFYDLAFLQKLSEAYGQAWSQTSALIDKKLKTVVFNDDKIIEITSSASEYLARSQMMLSVLLPAPQTPNFDAPLLQFGVPSAGQNYSSAVDLVKPSPRFGMLLVGHADQ